jgi:hypothetical protein
MTATTAIPLAVLTGLPFNIGVNLSEWLSGRAAKISTIFGILDNLNLEATFYFNFVRLIFSPLSYACVKSFTIS